MNSTSAQYSLNPLAKRGRTNRVLPATLVVLLLTAAPALAEPVKFNQVVQTLSSTRGVVDLRLNTLAQDPKKDGSKVETVAQGPKQTDGKIEPVISSIVVTGDGKTIGIEEIEDGEVEGTICDCGEIFIAGAASFPKWPFLFLAAVPLAFIDRDSNEQPTPTPPPGSSPTPTPTVTPTQTSTPTPTPEPASLLLFGTGLLAAGAGLRRRHAKSKVLVKNKEGE